MGVRPRAGRGRRRHRDPDHRGLLHGRLPADLLAGKSYTRTYNTAVFGPKINADYGVFRDGNSISGYLPLFADGSGHPGSSLYTSVTTTLYRNGAKIASNDDPLVGMKEFKVPAAEATYKLTTSVKRTVKVAAASTRIDASWTFKSKKADFTKLPTSTVRFNATTGLDSRVAAGKTVTIPVSVQGSAAGRNLKSLYVYVSYDYGQTWKMLKVKNGKITVKNPAKGRASPSTRRSPTSRATSRRSRSTTRTTESDPVARPREVCR